MLLFYTFFSSDLIGKLIILVLLGASFYSFSIIIKYGYFFYLCNDLGSNLKLYLPKMKKISRINMDSSMYLDVYDSLLDVYAEYGERIRDYAEENPKKFDDLVNRIYSKWEIGLIRDFDNVSILGSIAPFIGLLGTVLGIMNSFQAIAKANSNSITVVAPALSEALCVTALGIFVAIPANIAANYFYSKLDFLKKDMHLFKTFVLDVFFPKGVK